MDKYYEIKVTIRESHPPTWRRLRIPANITFNDLAAIIEIAFEWCGYHLYEFEVGATLHEMGQFIGVPKEDEYDIEGINTVIPIGENDNGNMLILCTEDNVFYGYTDGCLVKYGNTIEEMLECVIGENIMPEYID